MQQYCSELKFMIVTLLKKLTGRWVLLMLQKQAHGKSLLSFGCCFSGGWYNFGKIIKTVAIRGHILKLKCTKFAFGWGSALDPAAGAYSAPPDPVGGFNRPILLRGWLGSRLVSVLDSGTEGPGFKSQPRRCRITVLGKLFTPIVPLFTKQQN